MFESNKCLRLLASGCWFAVLISAAFLRFDEIAAAQDDSVPRFELQPQASTPPRLPFRLTLAPSLSLDGAVIDNPGRIFADTPLPHTGNSATTAGRVLRITLDDAQQLATAASNPALKVAEFQAEAAKQHRLAAQADYFPKIGGVFENLHLNKKTGQVLTVRRPFVGGVLGIPVNIISKDQTMFNFSLIQPLTPLFAVHQLVIIARADENIARAKAGQPVAQTAGKVEKNYFDLLIAERELKIAEADAKKVQRKWMRADSSGPLRVSLEQETEMSGAERAVALAAGRVKEKTALLNAVLGLPEGTRLELVVPAPLVENTSMEKAAQQAAAASPEVVEAEQTVIKARAALRLSKMQYFPSVSIIGGYANQNILNVVLPQDFSYIGFMATYNVFDFGKREHTVKERRAQVEAAEAAVKLVKAKVAAGVKNAWLELERSRRLSQMARRMVSAGHSINADYRLDDPEIESAVAGMETEMLRADLEYRQAYRHFRNLWENGDKP